MTAYPNLTRHRGALAAFGLSGDGPWPVVLPGYVLHALGRPTEEIRAAPYRPRAVDGAF